MKDSGRKRFATVSEAAEILGVSVPTITESIKTGGNPLAAIVLTGSHQSTRIPYESLAPVELRERDARVERIRRLQLAADRASEVAAGRLAEFLAAREAADLARLAVSDELALGEVRLREAS